jgi:hypothetical protein
MIYVRSTNDTHCDRKLHRTTIDSEQQNIDVKRAATIDTMSMSNRCCRSFDERQAMSLNTLFGDVENRPVNNFIMCRQDARTSSACSADVDEQPIV